MVELLQAALNLPAFALVLCRVAGVVLAAPMLSSMSVPVRVKAALSVLLALAIFPFAASAGDLPQGVVAYVPMVLTELGVGLVMGFAASVVLAALEAAGGLAAQQMGVALAHVVSPDRSGEKPALSALLGVFGLLLFLSVDGHHWLLQALAVSYRTMPLGRVGWSPDFLAGVVQDSFSRFILCALRLAAPLMGIMFLVTVMIALVAKAVPQMNILLVGYPVKVFIGLVALVLTFPLIWPVLRGAFQRLQEDLLFLVSRM